MGLLGTLKNKCASIQAFRVFRHRNYKLFFIGETVSISGFWMHRVALSWLVYAITGSTVRLGILDFAAQIPVLLMGSVTGAFMEGRDLRKLIFICQVLSMLQALALAVLTLTGHVQYWHILVLVLLIGISDSFEVPARQAFVSKLIDDPKDLGNGIAMTMSVFNVTRLVGPSMAGFVIYYVGEGLCFLMNAVSYTGTLIALSMLRFKRPLVKTDAGPRAKLSKNLKEGLSYVRAFPPIRNCLLGMALVSFFGFPYISFMSVFARDILGGKPQTLGFLMTALGFGALIASIRLAMRKNPVGLAQTMGMAAMGFGASLLLFSLSSSFLLSLLLIALVGFCSSTLLISCNTTIQVLVDDDKRSRVMSLQIVASMGITPLGSLLTGQIASWTGIPVILALWGAVCASVGLWLLRIYPRMAQLSRPVFERQGLLERDEREAPEEIS